MKIYKAIVWGFDPSVPGERTSVLAKDCTEARKKLEIEYGEDKIYSIWNEEDADRPR